MRISDWSSDVCSSDLGAGSVARRRRPLTVADRADLPALHVLVDVGGGPYAALLDQHGRGGDFHLGRRQAAKPVGTVPDCRRSDVLRGGPDPVLLGHRHLVASHAGGSGGMALPDPRRALRLLPALLGWR